MIPKAMPGMFPCPAAAKGSTQNWLPLKSPSLKGLREHSSGHMFLPGLKEVYQLLRFLLVEAASDSNFCAIF
jgi:hypothetical protein